MGLQQQQQRQSHLQADGSGSKLGLTAVLLQDAPEGGLCKPSSFEL
jgi:hypothetical protein